MKQKAPVEFIESLTHHQARLQGYIASLLPNQEATWDVLQETNRVLMEKHSDFVQGSSFVNWSLTVAQFQVMAWLRDKKRDRHVLTPELADLFSRDTQFVSWTNRDQRLIALDECLIKLSQTNRDLVKSRYARSETLQEIAEQTNKSINSLKQTFFRIRKQLLACIEQRIETS